jgi:hypothetical protein
LQKSKVASVRIFGETLKHKVIDDSDNLNRATEVAHEFCVRRCGPSNLYTKNAPTALRIFDTFGKTTFATLSAAKRTSERAMQRPVQGNKIEPWPAQWRRRVKAPDAARARGAVLAKLTGPCRALCRLTELDSPSSQAIVTSLQEVPMTVPKSVVVTPSKRRSPTLSLRDWSPVISV